MTRILWLTNFHEGFTGGAAPQKDTRTNFYVDACSPGDAITLYVDVESTLIVISKVDYIVNCTCMDIVL